MLPNFFNCIYFFFPKIIGRYKFFLHNPSENHFSVAPTAQNERFMRIIRSHNIRDEKYPFLRKYLPTRINSYASVWFESLLLIVLHIERTKRQQKIGICELIMSRCQRVTLQRTADSATARLAQPRAIYTHTCARAKCHWRIRCDNACHSQPVAALY